MSASKGCEGKRADRMNPSRERFILEFLLDLNASAAARRAGYSAKTAASQGHALLRNPDIQKAIRQANEARLKRTEVEADRVIRELCNVAFSDVGNLFDEVGVLKSVGEISPDARRAVASLESVELANGEDENRQVAGRIRRVRMWNKMKALDLLARHIGLFRDKVEIAGINGGPVEFSPAERAARIVTLLARAKDRAEPNQDIPERSP